MVEKFGRVLVLISAVSVIYVDYLSTMGAIAGITSGDVSAKFQNYLTPAGYSFTIWVLIYFGVILFTSYQLIESNSENLNRIRSLFILSCVANIAWVYAWHNQFLGLSMIAMFVLLSSLFLINLDSSKLTQKYEIFLVKVPFSLYFGWVSVAAMLNFAVYLTSRGLMVEDFTSIVIACGLLVLITAAGIIIREKLNIAFYPLTIAWACTAIAIKQSGKTAIVLICGIAVAVLIFSSLTFVLKDHKKLQ